MLMSQPRQLFAYATAYDAAYASCHSLSMVADDADGIDAAALSPTLFATC